MTPSRNSLKALLALVLMSVVVAILPAMANAAALPDPMIDGPHPVTTMSITPTTPGIPGDPGEAKLGLVNLEEPNGTGGAPNRTTPGAANAATLQVRGSLYYPSDTTTPAPLIVLVHGNHGSCHVAGTGADCSTFNRNDTGYAYLAQNLASWGYVVFSLDQDQLIYYQDGNYGKGMHQRRLLIAAALDGLYQANQPGGLPMDANDNVGTQLVGKIDFNRIGLMGHSRGGDAVSSFLDYNRTRPAPGRRYTIRAVLSLSPVDYERRAPSGVVFGLEAGACDGDVSNLQGVRLFSRSLRIDPTDPFPRIQMILQGANHDAFNTEWAADGDDSTVDDQACGPNRTTDPNNIRLTQGSYAWSSSVPGSTSNFFSANPNLMGDQERDGLATMSEFFRRYVGGETPFDPYMTGEVSSDGTTPQLPQSACPTAASGPMSCFNRLSTSYFAAPQEREDIIDPDPNNPLTVSALGTDLVSSGFADPYAQSPGTVAQPATATGLDWCNPEPDQFTPSQLGINEPYPTATKPCPMPAANDLGGQGRQTINYWPGGYTGSQQTPRENAPVNHSYEPQLTMAWNVGQPASLSTRVPAADGNVTKYRALALETSVNFFDTRNPQRSVTDPSVGVVHFGVTVTDAAGHSATVDAGDPKYGFGTQQTLGTVTDRVHVILRQVRIPVSTFTAQGVDMSNVRNISFQFGSGAGMSQSGSIQLADVRFQEAVSGPTVYAESPNADGPATNTDAVQADNAAAVAEIADTPRAAASPSNPGVIWLDGGAKAATTTSATTKTKAATCADTTKPTAKLATAKLVKGKLVLTGTSKDTSHCATKVAKVASVHLTIAKKVGKKCEFVTASGKLGKAVSCLAPVSLQIKAASKWSVSFAHKLPKGSYTVKVWAIDAAGNVGASGKGKSVKLR